jgi:MerR family transcriptional regulator, light-induced transcriptional regulator
MDLSKRTALAADLSALESPARVTEAMFSRHPEWTARFGAAGRVRCTEDGRHHLSFLAGAVQAGSAELFGDYIGWAAAMLEARHLDRTHLAEHLDLLRDDVLGGLAGPGVALVRACFEAAQQRLGVPAEPDEPPPDGRTPLRLAYLSAALAGNRFAAYAAVTEALSAGWPVVDVYRQLLLQAQRRLGELWSRGEISVAQEHCASAITQWTLARLHPTIPPAGPSRGRVLITGVEGELHGLPANFVADLLQLDGWEVIYLGTHLPTSAILSSVAQHRPSIVGISTTIVGNLPRTVTLVGALRASAPSARIVLGGRALRGSSLAADLGVEHDPTGELAPFAVHPEPPPAVLPA